MIVSFYSYKGGVGRSQLLVNLAAYLCFYDHKKILLIDWDLEAPGLHYYFKDSKKIQQKGLIDLLLEYCDFMNKSEGEVQETHIETQFKDNLAQFIVPKIAVSKNEIGQIDLMTAGLYDEQYTAKTNNFDWIKFYETLDGGFFLELLKRYLKDKDYDFIFIDSRTGISDYSGICNIQMPDANIVVIAPSAQNVEGSQKVIKSVENAEYIAKYQKRFPLIFPILSRLDPRDDTQKARWIRDFRENFKATITSLIKAGLLNDKLSERELNENVENYISNTLLEYRTDLSYGEQILFGAEAEKIEKTTLAYQIAYIANLLNVYAHYPNIDYALLPFEETEVAERKIKFKAIKGHFEQWIAAEKNAENMFDYAVFLQEAQQYKAALIQYKLAQNYISNPAKTLKVQNNMALAHRHLNQLDEAHQIFSQLIGEYPQNSDVLFNFANVLYAMNKLPLALEYSQNAIAIREKVLDKDHPDLAASYNSLSQIYQAMGKYALALEYQQKTIAITEKVLDKDHPDLANSYNNLSLIYQAMGNYPLALEVQERVIAITEKVLDKDQPNLAAVYNNLSSIYQDMGKMDLALAEQQKAIAIQEKVLGKDHPDLAASYNNRSLIYQAMGNIDLALEYQQKAIVIVEKVLGKDHPNLAAACNNLSTIYRAMGKIDLALTEQQKAIAIQEKVLGKDHPDLATSYNNLSNLPSYGQNGFGIGGATKSNCHSRKSIEQRPPRFSHFL